MKLYAVRNTRTDGVDLYATPEAAKRAAGDEETRVVTLYTDDERAPDDPRAQRVFAGLHDEIDSLTRQLADARMELAEARRRPV